jgi:hypothetical protein
MLMLDTNNVQTPGRGSASPFKSGFQWGCALGPGLAQVLWAKGRTMGLAQNLERLQRRGRASPHIRRQSRNLTDQRTFCAKLLKVQNRTWKQSVPSAVADGLPSRNAKLLLIMNMIASPIRPRTVLTVSKRDVLTFEARP